MSRAGEVICACGRRFMGLPGDVRCPLCTERTPESLDLKPIRKATVRQKAIEAFVVMIRDKWMTEMIAKSGNVEFVNTHAAMLREEAAELLQE